MLAPPDIPSLRACLAGLGLNSCSSLTVTPVFELRRVAVRMHRSTIINQLKSCEARLHAVIFIGGRLRKRNSAKQALTTGQAKRGDTLVVARIDRLARSLSHLLAVVE